MTIKEMEQKLIEYIDSPYICNHRENALKEFDMIREKFPLDDLVHIGFIIDNYPKYDHCLWELYDDNFFLRVGLNHDYLKKLTKEDIHKLAKDLYKLFGQYKLEE